MARHLGWKGIAGHSSLLALAVSLCAQESRAGILFRDDFEGGTGAWSLTGGWGTTTTGPHTPTRSLTDTPGYNYSQNASTTATKTTPISLASATRPRLMFWIRYSSEQFHDYLHVETSTNGVNWTTQNSYTGSQDTWRHEQIGLAGWAGLANIYVRFRVETNNLISGDGWYVDDIVFDDGNPAVTITSPVASTAWPGGSDQTIAWTYDGSWSPLATSLDVLYSTDGIGYSTLQAGLPIDTTSIPWTLPAGNATARVRVSLWDTYGIELAQTTSPPFAIDSAAPSTFALGAPADGACGSSTPSFDWTDATDATAVSYTLAVSPATGSELVKTGLATSAHTLAAGDALAEAGNPHDWTVTATDAAGNTRTTTTRGYTVDETPPASFALGAPADGTTTDGAGLVFSWEATTDAGCGLSHYVLSIDGDVCADDVAAGTTSIALDATSCAALGAGTHTWTVSAVDTAGNVAFSSASPGGAGGWEFTIPGGGSGGSSGGGSSNGGGSGNDDAGGEAGEASANGGTAPGTGGTSRVTGGTGGTELGEGGDAATGNSAGEASSSGGGSASGGTGGRNAAGGATSSGGSSGAATAGSGGQRPASPGASTNDDGGCGCRVASGPPSSALASLVSLLAALGFMRRRRRGGATRTVRHGAQ